MGLPGLRTHPKFRRLVALLRIPEAHALGHLQMLWETTWDHVNPVLEDATDVELAAGWVGEPGALCRALVDCGGKRPGFLEHVEDAFQVHDFEEHAPRWVKDKIRKRRQLAEEGLTISDLKRMAGRAGAAARWGEDAPQDGKPAQVCHEQDGKAVAKNGESCPSLPLPSLTLKQQEPKGSLSDPAKDPVQLAVEIWNQATAGKLPKAKVTSSRAKTIRTRMREPSWMEDFQKACAFLATSAFHQGQNDRGWVATLDFALQAGKATELAEKAAITKPSNGAAHGKQHHRTEADQGFMRQLAASHSGGRLDAGPAHADDLSDLWPDEEAGIAGPRAG